MTIIMSQFYLLRTINSQFYPPKRKVLNSSPTTTTMKKNSPRTYIDRSSLGSGATCNFGAKPALYFAVQGVRD
jgi:hypothetical protein